MDEMIADLPYRSRDEIDAVQERNFAATLDLVFERHPYYRQRFADMGLKRSDIGGLKDISRIPIIAKKDYMAEPEAFRMDCSDLPIEMQVTWDVMHTTDRHPHALLFHDLRFLQHPDHQPPGAGNPGRK